MHQTYTQPVPVSDSWAMCSSRGNRVGDAILSALAVSSLIVLPPPCNLSLTFPRGPDDCWLVRVEDPYLSGQYAVSFVQGFERNPQDPTHLQASACCKHYAANSMEDTTEGGVKLSRHTIDANITQQDLIDSYLAPFQACVEQVCVPLSTP